MTPTREEIGFPIKATPEESKKAQVNKIIEENLPNISAKIKELEAENKRLEAQLNAIPRPMSESPSNVDLLLLDKDDQYWVGYFNGKSWKSEDPGGGGEYYLQAELVSWLPLPPVKE